MTLANPIIRDDGSDPLMATWRKASRERVEAEVRQEWILVLEREMQAASAAIARLIDLGMLECCRGTGGLGFVYRWTPFGRAILQHLNRA